MFPNSDNWNGVNVYTTSIQSVIYNVSREKVGLNLSVDAIAAWLHLGTLWNRANDITVLIGYSLDWLWMHVSIIFKVHGLIFDTVAFTFQSIFKADWIVLALGSSDMNGKKIMSPRHCQISYLRYSSSPKAKEKKFRLSKRNKLAQSYKGNFQHKFIA